ncbi:MAG: 30S ribosomal protein S12 methylthiotransferase RimO [Clostridia bacterium]|nr:30S ribosomal protein S12 methylthiotransferase RimO [Clostridia bacterium]
MKIGFISLGCSKNLVDTEMMIGLFEKHGFEIVNNPVKAEVILINTCGFIESAKEEAINTILEMCEYKKKHCKYVIATGCLVKRYKEELKKAIPEVDLWIGCNDYDEFWKEVTSIIPQKEESKDYLDYQERRITTGNKTAYLKIAEGCSNHCTYCAIPMIRGPFISRKQEDIIKEARKLADNGIEEIIVIAQDTTKYGIDLYGESKLASLLKELEKIDKIRWIRFLYSYPETITDELIETVKNSKKICHYFDIPIQHIANPVLKRMNRHSDGESIRKVIRKIRKEIPDVTIRSTVMVGFPGETKKDFEVLYDFLKEVRFDKLGAFTYSKEDGTPAARLKEQIHPQTKKSRYNKIMKLQQEISKNNLEEKIGNTYEVLIEDISFDGKYYIGRSYMDVPDMDGVVFIENKDRSKEKIGKFVTCRIVDVQDYDLIGQLL